MSGSSRAVTRQPDVIHTVAEPRAHVVLLHSMYSSPHEFDELAEYLLGIGCNVICIGSPLRDLHWEHPAEVAVPTWYDYFTRRDGAADHDLINRRHLEHECDRVVDKISSLPRPVFLGGVSQGATLVYHILASRNVELAGAMCARSTFMHTLVPDNTRVSTRTNLLVFRGGADEIYNVELQSRALESLLASAEINCCITEKAQLKHNNYSRLQLSSMRDFVARHLEPEGHARAPPTPA